MLHIVEGLNGSGKSTFIDKRQTHNTAFYITKWANPLRWQKSKREALNADGSLKYGSVYREGMWESILHIFVDNVHHKLYDIYLDRSFISGAVYNTLSPESYSNLLDLLIELNCKEPIIIDFLVTPPTVCYDRLMNLRESDHQYKNYVVKDTLSEMREVYSSYLYYLEQLKRKGLEIHYIYEGMCDDRF